MKRIACTLSFVLFFSLLCVNATAQVEYVFSSTVTDEATLIEAYDEWFASDDAMHGQTVTLFAAVINGESAATNGRAAAQDRRTREETKSRQVSWPRLANLRHRSGGGALPADQLFEHALLFGQSGDAVGRSGSAFQ